MRRSPDLRRGDLSAPPLPWRILPSEMLRDREWWRWWRKEGLLGYKSCWVLMFVWSHWYLVLIGELNSSLFPLWGFAPLWSDWLVIVTFNTLNKILVPEEVQKYFLVGNPQSLWYSHQYSHWPDPGLVYSTLYRRGALSRVFHEYSEGTVSLVPGPHSCQK